MLSKFPPSNSSKKIFTNHNKHGIDFGKTHKPRDVVHDVFAATIKVVPTDDDVRRICESSDDMCRFSNNVLESKTMKFLRDTKVRKLVDHLYYTYLGRSCDAEALQNYTARFLDKRDFSIAELTKSLAESDERQHRIQQRKALLDISSVFADQDYSHLVNFDSCKGLKIKYMGPVGTTGYSQAAKAYVYALHCCGADVLFEPIQVHCCTVPENLSEKEKLLFSLMYSRTAYGVVILHSVPDSWPSAILAERAANPGVKIIGLTVWECDRICPEWVEWLNMCDCVVVPCSWNQKCFERQLKVPVYTVLNPIDNLAPAKENYVLQGVQSDEFVFLTISEWTKRKNIDLLVKTFVEEFNSQDKVVLYIKTSTANRDRCYEYIYNLVSNKENPPKVLVDCEQLTDAEITALHMNGDCYVSIPCAEGTGLGACEAAYLGKPVICSAYSAPAEYIKGCFHVGSYDDVPKMCTSLQEGHENCGKENSELCVSYPWYRADQRWSLPILVDVARTMRFVYGNRDMALLSAVIAQKYIQNNVTSQKTGEQFSKVIKGLFNHRRAEAD